MLLNSMSWRVTVVQLPFGQISLGSGGVGGDDGAVTRNVAFPFLISEPGMVWLPLAVNGTLFTPGACLFLEPGLPQAYVACASEVTLTTRSPFPSPVRVPVQN